MISTRKKERKRGNNDFFLSFSFFAVFYRLVDDACDRYEFLDAADVFFA
jgi:hypothetical protein